MNTRKQYESINWKLKNENELYDFWDKLENPTEQAAFLIYMLKNYPHYKSEYEELISDTADNLLYQHKIDLVEEMVTTFRENLPEEYAENYEFLEKSLIHYYFFQNNLSKVLDHLEIIKENPVKSIDTITIRCLYLLIYHGYYKEAYDYSLVVWEPIFSSDKIWGKGHAPFVINIYLYKLEEMYESIQKGHSIDWEAFRKNMKEHDFDEEKEVMDTVIYCLEHPFSKEEIIKHIKNKQHRKTHTMMNLYFSKYMKDNYNISFTHSDLMFNILAQSDLYKNKKNAENYFLFTFDKLDKQFADNFDNILFSNTEEIFGKVWGLEYVYYFIHECGMISDEGFEQMKQNIRTLKYLFISIVDEELWKMTFVFKWPHLYAPDPQEERMFRITFEEDSDESDEAFYNYKNLLYNTLPDHLKEKVNSPDYFPDLDDSYDMDGALDFPHSEEAVGNWSEPYVKEGEDTGRNDPCPCGSGKKYKKCCLNKKIN